MMQITSEQQEKLNKIGEKYDLALILAYGSYATGKPRADSDLDIAVLDNVKPDYERFKSLFSEVSDVFPGKNVDLRFLNDADPFFRYQVIKNKQLLFGQKAYNEYEIYAFKSYLDDGKKLVRLQQEKVCQNQELLNQRLL